MTDLRQGALFLVDFDPSVGHEYKKIRPAIIIQSDQTIKKTALITVMPVTSQLSNVQEEDIEIKKTSKNGLFSDSLVKAACIHSFDKKRFLKKIGNASEDIMEQVTNYLRIHFNME